MSKLDSIKQLVHDHRIVSVQINLLNACTSKCVYCRKYTWPKDMLDIDILTHCITYLRDRGLQSIVFSGGDPLMYPHLSLLLGYCQHLNIQTSLITTLITKNPDKIKLLYTYPTRIHCSIDSPDREMYAKLRGVDQLQLVTSNLTTVNEFRRSKNMQPIRISTVLSKENYMQVPEMYEFAKLTGSAQFWTFVHRHDEYCMSDEQWAQCKSELEKIALKDIAGVTSNANSIIHHVNPLDEPHCLSTTCGIPYIHCCINANGDVYPCCVLLDDNGMYGPQQKYVYGNINQCGYEFDNVFLNRFDQIYDIKNYCTRCEDRYINLIDDTNKILNDKQLKVRPFL